MPSLLKGIHSVSCREVATVSKWVKNEKYGFREKQLQPNAPARVSQRWKPAHFYWFAKMHSGKLPSAPFNFAFHVYNFTFIPISKSCSPLPLLQPSSMSANVILFREGARKAPTCGWKTWTDRLVKIILLSEGGMNSIPDTTHSKAIKQVLGRVCTCVFYEMWKQRKVSSKGLFSGMLTEQNLCHRCLKHFHCPSWTMKAGLFSHLVWLQSMSSTCFVVLLSYVSGIYIDWGAWSMGAAFKWDKKRGPDMKSGFKSTSFLN